MYLFLKLVGVTLKRVVLNLMNIVKRHKCLLTMPVLMPVVWLILKMFFMFVFIRRCINMYKGVLKFIKRETLQEEFVINIGIFNRPSTAAGFERAAVTTVELKEIVGLEHLVGELRVGDTLV